MLVPVIGLSAIKRHRLGWCDTLEKGGSRVADDRGMAAETETRPKRAVGSWRWLRRGLRVSRGKVMPWPPFHGDV